MSKRRRYTVIGPTPVHGTQPGSSFTKALDPAQETRLLQGGHIAVGNPKTPAPPAGAATPRKRGKPNDGGEHQ